MLWRSRQFDTLNMDNQRLFLYLALGFISMLLYQAWLIDYSPRPAATTPTATQQSAPASGQTASNEDVPEPGTLSVTADDVQTPAVDNDSAPAGQRITVSTDVLDLVIDTTGGTIVEAALTQYPVSIDEPDTPFQLLSDRPESFLIAQSGLQGTRDIEAPTHKATYRAAQQQYQLADGQGELTVPLIWQSGGVTVTKQFHFKAGSYQVAVDYTIDNQSGKPWSGIQYYQLQRKPVTSDETSQLIRTYTGGVISTDQERYKKVDFGDIEDENLSVSTTAGWVAMIQHYFGAAWIPPQEQTSTFYTIHLRSANRYILGMKSPVMTVEAGQQGTFSATGYVGPKVQDWLKEAAPHLELTVDFGFLTIIAQPLFLLMKMFHGWVGNWGWAIVLLTCLIKAVFYPLSQASYKSMARMKKLQPKLQALKERYGDDRARMGQETMELYKKEKVNPLGGCFPMLVQIPVFIALYWMLLESVELRQAPWALWIKDLSIKDPFFILPVIMGVTMFIQQKLNPAPVDPIQAKVFMFLPLIFTVFFAFFPAGLVLYWIVNNVLSIAQQYYITRHVIGDR